MLASCCRLIAVSLCVILVPGCGSESGPAPSPPEPEPVAAPAEEPKPLSVSEQVRQREEEMNRARIEREQQADAEPVSNVVLEPEYESPIPIVPTRPIYPDDPEWEEEPTAEPDVEETEAGEGEPPPARERVRGVQIRNKDVDSIWDQMSFYMVEQVLPGDGVLIDSYSKGILDYEVWEWRSEVQSEVNLVRIRFIDRHVSSVQRDPGPYMLMR